MTSLRSLARSIGLGRIAYRLYHRPRAALRETARRGFVRTIRMRRGRAAMVRAARALTIPPADGSAPVVHFLTGRKFWFQTAFCYRSLRNAAADQPLGIAVYDDGTFTDDLIAQIRHTVPGATIVTRDAIEARLDQSLPAARYPTLRRIRESYPNLRKLTDIHAGSSGWKLVLDSDMLFHRRPDELLRWLAGPSLPLCMTDVQSSYGYSDALMKTIAGHDIPSAVNVGVCGLRGDSLDWDRLESWTAALLDQEGMHYFLEQALVAMLFTSGGTLLPKHDYIVAPSPEEIDAPRGRLHHYVAEAKTDYLTSAWQKV